MRPSVELATQITNELQQFEGGRPAVSIHVRHCDKGLVEASLRPLTDYMKLLRSPEDQSANKTAQVQLVTDDQAIYRVLDLGTESFPGFRFVRQDDAAVDKYRACAWACGGPVRVHSGIVRGGLHGSGSCYLAYQRRALVDLHVLARAPVGAFTWSSNYGMMFVSLQLFVNAFCSVALPVDNVQSGAGNSTIYLQNVPSPALMATCAPSRLSGPHWLAGRPTRRSSPAALRRSPGMLARAPTCGAWDRGVCAPPSA